MSRISFASSASITPTPLSCRTFLPRRITYYRLKTLAASYLQCSPYLKFSSHHKKQVSQRSQWLQSSQLFVSPSKQSSQSSQSSQIFIPSRKNTETTVPTVTIILIISNAHFHSKRAITTIPTVTTVPIFRFACHSAFCRRARVAPPLEGERAHLRALKEIIHRRSRLFPQDMGVMRKIYPHIGVKYVDNLCHLWITC